MEQSRIDEAKVQLAAVAQHAKLKALRHVAIIRMARLLKAEKSYDQALKELALIHDKGYASIVYELRAISMPHWVITQGHSSFIKKPWPVLKIKAPVIYFWK